MLLLVLFCRNGKFILCIMVVPHEWIFYRLFFESWHLVIRRLMRGLGTNYALFCTFSIEMYYHIVHNGSIPWVKFLECIFKLFHMLIRGLMKGLSPNLAIFCSSSTEMHLFVMHYVLKN